MKKNNQRMLLIGLVTAVAAIFVLRTTGQNADAPGLLQRVAAAEAQLGNQESRLDSQQEQIDALTNRLGNTTVTFSESLRQDNPRRISLGDHTLCFLNKAGETHQNQACICTVSRNGTEWTLFLNADASVRGSLCNCQAACFDIPAE